MKRFGVNCETSVLFDQLTAMTRSSLCVCIFCFFFFVLISVSSFADDVERPTVFEKFRVHGRPVTDMPVATVRVRRYRYIDL